MMDKITQTADGYKVTIGGQVMAVPNDPENEDYQRVQKAIAGGMELTVPPGPTAAQLRATMDITPLQGILTLGEARWAAVLAFRDGTNPDLPPASWAQKIIIDSAENWERLSENMQFIGWVLGYGPEEMDALFIDAAKVTA